MLPKMAPVSVEDTLMFALQKTCSPETMPGHQFVLAPQNHAISEMVPGHEHEAEVMHTVVGQNA